jgi:chorismate dehydratase
MFKDKIKVSAVSYLNSKPFIYGLENSSLGDELDLCLDIPSETARKLLNNEVDLGLVPVAIIPLLKNASIISDFCIGSHGPVKTVSIFSNSPIFDINHLILDYQSRTSVLLARILLDKYWKIQPKVTTAKHEFLDEIKNQTAGLIIGDRTIGLENRFPYIYDLSEAWYNFTQLPFVFAAWVSNCAMEDNFVKKFNNALHFGLENIEIVAKENQPFYKDFNVLEYYKKYISYDLNADKRKGMGLFLDHIRNL